MLTASFHNSAEEYLRAIDVFFMPELLKAMQFKKPSSVNIRATYYISATS